MIEINNLTNFSIDRKFFLTIAKKVLKGENRETTNLSIAFVNSKEIQKINKKFRKKDKPTDVLSFEKSSKFKDELSEVIICPDYVKKNMDSRVSLKKELAKMLIHGILHTLGYDHEISILEGDRMFKKQEYYIAKI